MATESCSRDDLLLRLSRKLAHRLRGQYPPGYEFDEVVSEAFLLARKNAARYESEKPDHPVKLWMWVRTMGDLKDRFDNLRKQSRIFRTTSAHANPLDSNVRRDRRMKGTSNAGETRVDHCQLLSPQAFDPEKAAIERADLREAVSKLPKNLRDVVSAVYFDGMSQDEAAEHFGVSQPAISKSLTRAFEKLKGALGDDYAVR